MEQVLQPAVQPVQEAVLLLRTIVDRASLTRIAIVDRASLTRTAAGVGIAATATTLLRRNHRRVGRHWLHWCPVRDLTGNARGRQKNKGFHIYPPFPWGLP
jgi:hypothetical protein